MPKPAEKFTREEQLARCIKSLRLVNHDAKATFDEAEFMKRAGVPEDVVWEAMDAVQKESRR